jgi:predicted O-methyltransferase YrrM
MSDINLLKRLADICESDKGFHGYMELYHEYFLRQGFTRENVKQVLEIGTNKGSSLRMWAEFFPDAYVHGIDITRDYEVAKHLEHPHIHTRIVDQGDAIELQRFLSAAVTKVQFDLIIDDGSHDQYDQQLSLSLLFDRLRPGGLYVVEDLITGENWWSAHMYNKKMITPTREVLQNFQKNNVLPFGLSHIRPNCAYCEYRETPVTIYDIHHPQIAFLART